MIEESSNDVAEAHDGDPAEWCDTRLVLERSALRDLRDRLEAGIRGPREENQLRAAASRERCLSWAQPYAEQLRKIDEDELKASRSGLEITKIHIHGDTARAASSEGEGENRGATGWSLVELTDGDWRVLQDDEVPTIYPAPG